MPKHKQSLFSCLAEVKRFFFSLTEVDVVFSAPLTVHLIDEEAGERFQDEAEDGHSCAEAEQVSCWGHRVKY